MTLSPRDRPALARIEAIAYRFGVRTPCCDRIVRHIDAGRILCRGCGTIYRDVTAGVLQAFPGTVDHTTMTPARFRGGATGG